nr:rRNA maturation RNase YbeY [uncultured Carboxylicivirga sp.]
MINFQVENELTPNILTQEVKDWIVNVANSHNFIVGDLNYLFCTDSYILDVNNQYLNHDYYTDIITFDYSINNVISGDLVISIDTVLSNSSKFSLDFVHECLRVIIHGVLHLCGFKDKTKEEEVKMRELEDQALNLYATFK